MDWEKDEEWVAKEKEVKDTLKASGLWSDKQIDALQLCRASSPEDGTPMCGLSTYNAGELLGTSYKNIQAYCNSGKMKSGRDILFSRVIPVEEVINWKLNHSYNKGK